MVKVKDIGYVILLREIVIQLKINKIYSGNKNNATVMKLDWDLFPEELKKMGSLSDINTRCKVNINYITEHSGNIRLINNFLFTILSNSKIINNNGIEYLVFKEEKDQYIFKLFKLFKQINSDFYDNNKKLFKKYLHQYQNNNKYKKVPYDKNDKSYGLGPRSIILISPENEILYINKKIIEYKDFFKYEIFELKDFEEVKNNLSIKFKDIKLYNYMKDFDKNNFLLFENDFIKVLEESFFKIEKYYKRKEF